MKRFTVLLLMLCASACMARIHVAQFYQPIATSGGVTNYVIGATTTTQDFVESVWPLGTTETNGWLIGGDVAPAVNDTIYYTSKNCIRWGLNVASNGWIRTPLVTNGIASLSFWSRGSSAGYSTTNMILQMSADNTNWSFAVAFLVRSNLMNFATYTVNQLGPKYFRFYYIGKASSSTSIDDILWTSYTVAP